MVATVRCEEIANEKFASLRANEVRPIFDIFGIFYKALILKKGNINFHS